VGALSGSVLAVEGGASNPWINLEYLSDNWDRIVPYLGEHVRLTLISVLLGTVLALPLSVVAHRLRYAAGPILGASTLLYTIPSLAMFAFIAPITGLTPTTVIIGLVLYSLVILVRNFLAGLQSVPADVREAARGMGYGPVQLFFKVEVPLALPSFMTGLRVATVSTVALVTVGVIIGQGGLGQLIVVEGFRRNYFKAPIVFGTILCVLLALLLDQILAYVERRLTPWTQRRAT
jgi:osmoprotectant transport system permease protein